MVRFERATHITAMRDNDEDEIQIDRASMVEACYNNHRNYFNDPNNDNCISMRKSLKYDTAHSRRAPLTLLAAYLPLYAD